MLLKIIGGLLIAFGAVDMLGSYGGLDVWGDWIGVELPELLWQISAWIEIGLGFFLFRRGASNEAIAAEHTMID